MLKFNLRYIHSLFMAILAAVAPAQAKPSEPKEELGQHFEKQYAEQLESLKAELIEVIPEVGQARKDAVEKALEAEATAKDQLEEARKDIKSVYAARGLVAHAKNKWIAGAEKDIKAVREKLDLAETAGEREALQEELAKCQKNLEAGLVALKEREAHRDEVSKHKDKYAQAYKAAEEALKQARMAAVQAVRELHIEPSLMNDGLDAKLAKHMVMMEATPQGLAAFAQQGDGQKDLIEEMLSSDDLLLQVAVADGAKNGQYGEAMRIYNDIRKASDKATDGSLQRLALAVALEHATPIKQNNAEADSKAPATVDPVKRYLHFEKAFLNGELDPAFKDLSTWDYRMVVNGEEPDEILAWGRDMLRNYRPDHISSDDELWRYVRLVRTDIPYTKNAEDKLDRPELHPVQKILATGGTVRPKALFGCYLLRAFGVPVVTIQQQAGHHAIGRRTPQGWVTCLGAPWGKGRPMARYDKDLDFLANTKARAVTEPFMQVKRAQWIGDLMGESRAWGLQSDTQSGFWYRVSFYLQEDIINQAKAAARSEVDHDLKAKSDDGVESIPAEAKEIVVDKNGVITIPSAACSRPTGDTRKIKFMPSNLGGMQLHYLLTSDKEDFEYTFDAPVSGEYALSARVVTPSWNTQLQVAVNGSEDPINIELPYTVGMWGETQSVQVTLKKGANVMIFSGENEDLKGLAIKDFTLTPLSSDSNSEDHAPKRTLWLFIGFGVSALLTGVVLSKIKRKRSGSGL